MTQSRWQRLSEWPLTAAAVIFLVAYTWAVIGDLRGPADLVAETVITATWVMFALDYLANLTLAPRRWKWLRRGELIDTRGGAEQDCCDALGRLKLVRVD
ncbi:hypothetical protein [Cryobacterium sp. TMS1-13-1]|uniref:hypothetical protein n=1 Tax=Cryobacterium sp. TMS1-13-1 TaxID=1259220 RepID=UPI00106C535B|nr:hypothetical protein [Cryobacterium sp. TMS1-13-1]TFD21480.1 hypothetical protein E3T31_11815 [Cryobacterium sp. TMS1-13-1]